MFNLFGLFNKKAKLPVWQWNEGRTIQRMDLEVASGVVEDNKTSRSFHMIQDFMMRDHIKGGLAILTWQRDSFPRNPFRDIDEAKKEQLKDINKIADEAGRTAKDKAIEDNRRNKMLTMFTILGYMFGITILLFLIFMVWKSGGIHLW